MASPSQPEHTPIARRRSVAWSRGGLTWNELLKRVLRTAYRHRLSDRAAVLSFYFLVSLFPLLIVLTTVVGFVLSSESSTYFSLVNYLDRIMPQSAFRVLEELLSQISSGASGGKLTLGVALALWTASSGVSALIEAMNVAFEVRQSRSWWHRRLVAIGLTLAIGAILTMALFVLLTGSTVFRLLASQHEGLEAFSQLSDAVRWLAGLGLLFLSLIVIYALGPNLKRRRWEGILPGTAFALLCWLVASGFFRLYLASFGNLSESYGSLAGVIALLYWLYLSGAAILLGGELNAAIWCATAEEETLG